MYWADMDFKDRRNELEEALSIGTQFRDPWNTATAMSYLGLYSSIQGNYAEARFFLERSLEIWRKMGSGIKSGMSWTLNFLGDVAYNQNEIREARLIYEESAALLGELGDQNFLAYALRRLALIAWREQDYDKAILFCKESLLLNRELGDVRGVLASLVAFAVIAFAQGQLERSASLMSAVEAQLKAIGMRLLPIDKMEYERNLAVLYSALDEKMLNRFKSKGREMALEDAVTYALQDT
jgi:tetratricopeptide (TPR) repeat protein